MKKILTTLMLALIITLMMTTAAFAKPGKGNPKGEILSIDQTNGTLTILTTDGDELVITLPDDFDYETVEVGMDIVAKGTWTDDGFEADWVKEADKDNEAETTEEADEDSVNENDKDRGEGGAYCAGDKDKPHPMAAKIALDYGVSEEWVMEQVCAGHGFGSVMLALKTQSISGDNPEDLLNQRKNGKGWGQIWKESGVVGSDHANMPPPGLLNKYDKGNAGKAPGRPEEKGPPGPPEDKGKPDDKGSNANNDENENNDSNDND
jgi:hypothetical protein